jgi:hypothetical protein
LDVANKVIHCERVVDAVINYTLVCRSDSSKPWSWLCIFYYFVLYAYCHTLNPRYEFRLRDTLSDVA